MIERAAEDGMAFWVIGGEYTDTRFERIAGGRPEERLGPFATFEEARKAWAGRAFSTVDDCHARYRIVETEDPLPSR